MCHNLLMDLRDVKIICLVLRVIGKEIDEEVVVVQSGLVVVDDVIHLGVSGVGEPNTSWRLHWREGGGDSRRSKDETKAV